jgi:sugar/nucleoside kinase (ribokinase family)
VDLLMVNDSEARELSGEYNLLRAARWIQARGPDMVVVKKGEHGAILFTRDFVVLRARLSAGGGVRPHGRRRRLRRRLHRLPGPRRSVEPSDLRRAMVYGSAMGSFAVERFGVDRFHDLTVRDIHERVSQFRELTAFEQPILAEEVHV